MACRLHDRFRVQSWIKGAFVGISVSLVIAVAMGISIACGNRPGPSILGTPRASGALFGLIVLGVPVSTTFAILLARLETPGFGPRARTFLYVVIALLFLTLCLPFWPGLATCSVPITILHAIALARWTAPRSIRLPKAIVL